MLRAFSWAHPWRGFLRRSWTKARRDNGVCAEKAAAQRESGIEVKHGSIFRTRMRARRDVWVAKRNLDLD
jgi:hypothetical protein